MRWGGGSRRGGELLARSIECPRTTVHCHSPKPLARHSPQTPLAPQGALPRGFGFGPGRARLRASRFSAAVEGMGPERWSTKAGPERRGNFKKRKTRITALQVVRASTHWKGVVPPHRSRARDTRIVMTPYAAGCGASGGDAAWKASVANTSRAGELLDGPHHTTTRLYLYSVHCGPYSYITMVRVPYRYSTLLDAHVDIAHCMYCHNNSCCADGALL